jgi:hypothetical protein
MRRIYGVNFIIFRLEVWEILNFFVTLSLEIQLNYKN